jgi:hypothetical protein
MRIYLDLDSRRLLTTPTRPLSSLEFKRRDNDSIELQFLRDAAVQELPAGTTARVGIKPDGDYDAAFLAMATLTQSGTGALTFYSGELNLHTTAMATAFDDEPVTISAMLEVEWVTGDVVSSSKTLPVTIANDVIRGDEGDPVDTSDFKATQAQAEAGIDNATWMTPLRTKQAIAELAATDWDSVSDKPSVFEPSAHTHTLSQLTQSAAAIGQVATWNGTAWVPQTASAGVTSYNDLTNVPTTFPPATHSHGNITNAGAIGTTSGVPLITGASGVLQAGSFGATSGTFAEGNHTHAGMLTAAGGITSIAVVATMPANPSATTLYIVTA